MGKLKLDHIGIVVKNLQETAAAFENAIGLRLEEIENYKETIKIGFVPVGSMNMAGPLSLSMIDLLGLSKNFL